MSKHKRYVNIKKYANLCSVGVHAIYARIHKSWDGLYKQDNEMFLNLADLPEVDAEVIDTKEFPPRKFKSGRKAKKN